LFSTNEETFEVFLASNQGKELVQAAARKVLELREDRTCQELVEDKKVGAVRRHPWKADFKRKEEDRKISRKRSRSQNRKTVGATTAGL
jgi:hypothetical protein